MDLQLGPVMHPPYKEGTAMFLVTRNNQPEGSSPRYWLPAFKRNAILRKKLFRAPAGKSAGTVVNFNRCHGQLSFCVWPAREKPIHATSAGRAK